MATFLLLLLLATAPSAIAPPALVLEDITGIWRMCYEPGLSRISELDEAFLVLQPDLRYVKVTAGISSSDITESGTFELRHSEIVLMPDARHQANGRPAGGQLQRTTLKALGKRKVVLGPDFNAVRELQVLSHNGVVNYAWAKVL